MWLAAITGAIAVLCALLSLFSAVSGKPVLACAFAGVAAGAASLAQPPG